MPEVKFTGRVLVSTRIRRLVNRLNKGVRESFGQKRIENLIIRRTKDRFAPPGSSARAARTPAGRPWEPLHSSTRERRRVNVTGRELLVDTGQLRNSIRVLSGTLANAVGTPSGLGVNIGSNDPKAAIHQRGGVNEQGRMVPARPFIGISQADVAAVDRAVTRIMRRNTRGL